MELAGLFESSLVGGRVGHYFRDITAMLYDGSVIVSGTEDGKLDLDHPIQQIRVIIGNVVEGFEATYQIAGGGSVSISHGHMNFTNHTVTFDTNEVLLAVFGQSSQHMSSEVRSIGFIIRDTVLGTVRTEGPFGANTPNESSSDPYYISNVIAFGGFEYSALGVLGLVFFKRR